MSGYTVTRSPGERLLREVLICTIRPQSSWPSVRGGLARGWVPATIEMSEPQKPHASTLSNASSSPMTGMGISVASRRSGPRYRAASIDFIGLLLSGVSAVHHEYCAGKKGCKVRGHIGKEAGHLFCISNPADWMGVTQPLPKGFR